MSEEKEKNPSVYQAVRAVGTLRPKFNPSAGKIFSDELQVVGTAFWLKKEKSLVTCMHVVQNLLNNPIELAGLLVVGKAGNYRRAIISILDIQHDLAVLTLLDDTNQPLSGAALDQESGDGLELVNNYPKVSSDVAFAGFPLGNQLLDQLHSPTYSTGVIGVQQRHTNQRKEIQISATVVGGFSGAPIVLKNTNKLLGVVSNGPAANGISTGICMAISWEHIKSLGQLVNS